MADARGSTFSSDHKGLFQAVREHGHGIIRSMHANSERITLAKNPPFADLSPIERVPPSVSLEYRIVVGIQGRTQKFVVN